MRKFLPLVPCLSLSIFTVARATKQAHAFAAETDVKPLVTGASTEEEVASDIDDTIEGASNDEDEDLNDDHGGDATSDGDTRDDDAGDDDGGDDGGGDEGK
jgi:hypothetical protein